MYNMRSTYVSVYITSTVIMWKIARLGWFIIIAGIINRCDTLGWVSMVRENCSVGLPQIYEEDDSVRESFGPS